MKPLLILADDLTGAADTAARCHSAGLPATLWLHPPQPPLASGAIAFTSDSRHLTAQEAAARVEATAASLRAEDAVWYKKIDSTLRGNIGAELDALLDLLNVACAVVCSAFPAQGRTLRDGFLHAPGVHPQTVHLPTLLRAQSTFEVVHVSLEAVRAADVNAWRRDTQRGKILFAVDATTDEDLVRILNAVEETVPDALLCGSAGLVGALATRMRGDCEAQGPKATTTIPSSLSQQRQAVRATVVVGSGSPMAHRQIESLCEETPDATRLVVEPDAPHATPDTVSDCVLLHQPSPAADAVLDGPVARQRAFYLAERALAVIRKQQPDLLVLVGGDTAVHVLTALGVDHLVVEREVLPGIPLCRPGERAPEAPHVILKPGSFGDERTLVTLLRLAADLN